MHWWKIFFYLVLEKCTGAAAHIRQKAKSSDAESGDFGKVFKYRRIGVGALHAELHLLAAPLLREVHDGPAIGPNQSHTLQVLKIGRTGLLLL